MPVTRVPVVHNFGISSRSGTLQITTAATTTEKKKGDKDKKHVSPPPKKNTSCPVITLDFISKYNSAGDPEKEELNGVLIRVLEHAKYKCCSFKGGSSAAVVTDVSEGWLELIALCQCCGTLQQESLVTLTNSLSSSPLSRSHIPVLFYIAGIGYHWIKEGSLFSPQFRTGELILLQVLFSVSLRLYHHHLTGTLQELCTAAQIRQLKYDFDGLLDHSISYKDVPEAQLHFKIITEVGNLICQKYDMSIATSSQAKPTTTPITSVPSHTTMSLIGSSDSSGGDHVISSVLWHALDVWQCCYKGCDTLNEALTDLVTCSTDFNTEPCLDGVLAMSILCSAAQRNQKVLHFVQGLSVGASSVEIVQREKEDDDMVNKESTPAPSVAIKNNVATLNVLGVQPKFMDPESSTYTIDSSKDDETRREEEDINNVSNNTLSVCTQALIENESIPDTLPPTSTEPSGSHVIRGDEETTTSLEEPSTFKDSYSSYLIHISSQYNQSQTSPKVEASNDKKTDKRVTLVSASAYNPSEEERGEEEDDDNDDDDLASSVGTSINRINLLDDRFEFVKAKEGGGGGGGKGKIVTLTLPQVEIHRPDSHCTHYTHSTAPFSWGAGVLGSIAPGSTVYQPSILSTPSTIKTDLSTVSLTNFTSWSWEVKLTYAVGLADIVMYGRDSNLQSVALMGRRREDEEGREEEKEKPALLGYSLVDLASYDDDDAIEGTHDSWKIRCIALQGLTRIHQSCREIPSRDGFSSVAWNIIQSRKRKEKHAKALNAYKLQQLYPAIVKFLAEATTSIPVSLPPPPALIDNIAMQLSNTFLPPVTNVITITTKKKPPVKIPLNPKAKGKVKLGQYDNVAAKVQTKGDASQAQKAREGFRSKYLVTTSKALDEIAKREWEQAMKEEDEKKEEEIRGQKQQEDKEKKTTTRCLKSLKVSTSSVHDVLLR